MAIPAITSYQIPTRPLEGGPSSEWAASSHRAALLIHDMQRYFIAPYDLQVDPIKTVISNIALLMSYADSHGIPVFFSAQPPAQHATRRGLLTSLWGEGIQTNNDADIIAELHPQDHHHIITKWRYSAFERTDLLHSLSYAGRDQLLVTGVYGHMGCKVTAVDAFMKDIQPFLITDAIADFNRTDHIETITWVNRRCGQSLTTADAIAQLNSVPAQP